ncbi:hypothetical protein [Emticicia aquatilis]|nr:hypothetical protein [Emticicia aquatilis]
MRFLRIFIVLSIIAFSCSKEKFKLDEVEVSKIKSEVVPMTCGENTISSNTSFGFFCPGQPESDVYQDNDKNFNFYYHFYVSNNPYGRERFSVNFIINSLNVGTQYPIYSQVKALNKNEIPWVESGQKIPSNKPKKIIVLITESTPTSVSGYYKIELTNDVIFDGYFNKLKVSN